MMGAGGYGWMSGEAMRPISMRINSEIARKAPKGLRISTAPAAA
jgi:hypothetical protein